MEAKISLLLVDDSSPVCTLVRRVLTNSPFEVVGMAGTGEEAVAVARVLRPDVILLDRELPDDHEFKTLRALVQEDPPPRVIIFSGDADPRLIAEAIALGASGYVEKGGPLQLTLLRTLRAVTSGMGFVSSSSDDAEKAD